MIELTPPLRLATEADATQLADLVNFAGEGMPLHLWKGLAQAGEDPWIIGRDRQAAKARDGQIVVVDQGKGAIAGLTGYEIGSEPEPIGSGFPALFRPLQELENEALETWYVNVLACYPAHRSRGHGTGLLRVAEAICRAAGLSRLSIIVASNNTGARRLYERVGYIKTASRPCIKEDWETEMESWDLMIKSL
ncbi:MAG: GNAT family N-acetyltransferase [Pseudomonadota bacterium]